MKKYAIPLLAAILLVAGLGCAALSTLVTPATINRQAVTYAVSAGVIDANEFQGYANLDKAIRLKTAVDAAFQVKELSMTQMMEKNRLDYSQLSQVATSNMEVAQAQEAQLFGEKGLLSMGLGLLGFGTLTGTLGLMRKRPQDWSQTEVDTALAELKVETQAARRQFTEVVAGVQAFLSLHPKGEAVGDELRAKLEKQSLDTRQAVAVAKTSVAVV
ncbi:MAG: hypothetical protein EHM35_03130 [Planctomycetaceae bacterium]|nr:MAG: hypothetical protein EHM35_03130 [Planctomycetaceae bacterium]